MDSGLITVTTVTLSTLIGQLLNTYREKRNRKWDKEDRDVKAQSLAEDLTKQADKLAEHAAIQTGAVISKIDENTQVSVNAFSEANNTNSKIQAMGERIEAMGERIDALIHRMPCQNSASHGDCPFSHPGIDPESHPERHP